MPMISAGEAICITKELLKNKEAKIFRNDLLFKLEEIQKRHREENVVEMEITSWTIDFLYWTIGVGSVITGESPTPLPWP